MIIIGPSTGAPAPVGDVANPVPIGSLTIDDMFGEIIAGMTAAAGAEAVGEQSAAPVLEGEAAPPAPEASAAASVVQLLTLTVKQQAKALAEPDEGEPQQDGEAEGQTPVAVESDAVADVATATIAPVVQAPTQQPAQAAHPKVEVPAVAQHVAKQPKEPKPASIIEADQPTKPDMKSPVALAVAELMQATRQLGLPMARRAAPDPVVRGDESAPKNFGQEVKQVVHAAISSMQAQPAPLPFEVARPLETILEPLAVEPQVDPSEVAIERQLDVSAEGEWLDSLAKDIARTAGEGGTLRFKLNPENLGTLRVEITPQANGSAVRLTADTDAARTIIADAQTRLVAEAKANGVRISETHVDLGGQTPSGDPRRQNAAFDEAPIRTARFLRDQEESDGKPTPSKSERYA